MYDELVMELREADKKTMCGECGLNLHSGATKKGVLFAQAADAIEELSAIREEQKAQIIAMVAEDEPRWIPVTERLPKYGERVLVFGGVTMYVAYYDKNRYGGESWHKLNSKSHYCNPTHWMPLPQPPKEKKP